MPEGWGQWGRIQVGAQVGKEMRAENELIFGGGGGGGGRCEAYGGGALTGGEPCHSIGRHTVDDVSYLG